ncbi:YkgJ family cysteine cluster protein [Luteimonas sp. 3794]|uniref:YkgJ family cysteine cluster protein n=1 Tax=Luteimonas sp. 3794 TaxID=2817730 RepID=UPI002854DA56|nr:YkgJ family cysteine cluster protein [Luteimonas sp. 3794]MDR6990351.1 Fe-S-cluster containining protein [Luteimonas sp. 3794]
MRHPCMTCGACCSHYRVSMHWMETDASGGVVPQALTEGFGPHQVVMRGTWETQPRCIALEAEIGTFSRCTIHAVRPQACRDVQASWETGEASPQCDRARLAHGLPVLGAADWTSAIDLVLLDTNAPAASSAGLSPAGAAPIG